MLSLFESLKRSSSMSLKEIKLIAILLNFTCMRYFGIIYDIF